jgi:Arc/MetJ-type ribon-helix-helix transcriptional regulator
MAGKINRSFMLTPEQVDILEELYNNYKYKTLSEIIGIGIEKLHKEMQEKRAS